MRIMISKRGKDISLKKVTGFVPTKTVRTLTSQEGQNVTDVEHQNLITLMTIDKKDITQIVTIGLDHILGLNIVNTIIIALSMKRTIDHDRIVESIKIVRYKGNHFLDLVEYSKKETGDVIIVKILTLNGEINVINVDVLKEI